MGSDYYTIFFRPTMESTSIEDGSDDIYDHSFNGIMVDNDALMQSEIPNSIWDCGLDIKDGNLIMSGGVGPCGYGEAIVKIPLEYFKDKENLNWFYIECENEEDLNIIKTIIDEHGWIIEKIDEE